MLKTEICTEKIQLTYQKRNQQTTLWTGKKHTKLFCHIFHKTQSILIPGISNYTVFVEELNTPASMWRAVWCCNWRRLSMVTLRSPQDDVEHPRSGNDYPEPHAAFPPTDLPSVRLVRHKLVATAACHVQRRPLPRATTVTRPVHLQRPSFKVHWYNNTTDWSDFWRARIVQIYSWRCGLKWPVDWQRQ